MFKKQCDAQVTLIKSGGGVFEVVVNGELVYSKKATGCFPDEQMLMKQISESKV